MSAIYSNYDDEVIQQPRPKRRSLVRRLLYITLWLGLASLTVLILAGTGSVKWDGTTDAEFLPAKPTY